MKRYDKGFSLIEVLVAKSMILVLIATFIPIYTTITYEHAVLKSRLLIASSLHDQLQPIIWNNGKITNVTKEVNDVQVTFSFKLDQRYIKGCAKWKNQQNRKEEICLYGLDTK